MKNVNIDANEIPTVKDPVKKSRSQQEYERELCILESILANIADAVMVNDEISKRFVYVNDKACQLLGYTRCELLEMTLSDINSLFSLNIKGLALANYISYYQSSDGNYLPIEVATSVFTIKGISYRISQISDVSDTKSFYREVFGNLHESVCLFEVLENSQFLLLEINSRCEKLLGLVRSQVLGKRLDEIYVFSSQNNVREKFKKCIELKMTTEEFSTLMLPKGLRIVKSVLIPQLDSDGDVSRIIAITTDITEQEILKQKVEVNQELLSKAEVFVTVGYFYIDFSTRKFHCSRGVYEIFGVHKDEYSADYSDEYSDVFKFMSPEVIKSVRMSVYRAFKNRSKFNETYRITDNKGVEKTICGTGHFVNYSKSKELFFGNVQEIGNLTSLNDQLRYDEERLRAFIENSTLGVFVLSKNRHIYVNKALLDIARVDTSDQFMKLNHIELIYPDDQISALKLYDKLWNDKRGHSNYYQLTLRSVVRNNRIEVYDLRIVSFWQNGIKSIKVTVIDITEEKEREKLINRVVTDSLYINKKNDAVANIMNELNEIIYKNKYDVNVFSNIFKTIDSYVDVGRDWKIFVDNFDKLHPDFISNLKLYCSSLTANDVKHCACIKMNISTKEIAFLFNVSPSSIQIARVRLKKKLNLPESTDLRDFISIL